jgi:hypothetical protein
LKKFIFLLFSFGCLTAIGQETTAPSPDNPVQPNVRNNTLTSLAGELFNSDFFNIYAYGDGVYDSTQQTLGSSSTGGAGFSVGGGITGSKTFGSAILSVNYRGDFRDYSTSFGSNGTDQYLSLIYTKRLSRRWTISFVETGGILFYGNAYYSTLTPGSGSVDTNPFSPTTRFLSSGVTASYRQTARLTYSVTGDFYLNRYSYPGAIGSTGGVFSGSAMYQLTPRTSVGVTYSHDNFYFQQNAGSTTVDGGFLTMKYKFGRNWEAYGSGGVTRAHSQGIITIPVEVIVGGQPVTGYAIGNYDTVKLIPTFTGGVTHRLGSFNLAANAGHSVNPGNGTYLTSSNTFFGGVISRSVGKQSTFSASVTYSRLSSIANQISQSYSQTFLTASYSRILVPHVSCYFAYQYDRYGSLLGYGSSSLNRILVGFAFSTKNVPMTQF